jgi:hypothetical protein
MYIDEEFSTYHMTHPVAKNLRPKLQIQKHTYDLSSIEFFCRVEILYLQHSETAIWKFAKKIVEIKITSFRFFRLGLS